MKIVLSKDGYSSIVKMTDNLPVPGRYYILITDAVTHLIEPFYEEQETCLVVSYKLANTETLEVFEFEESYYPYTDNPRTKDFLAFLNMHGYDFLSDDEIVGIKATVDIVYEVLGGCVHPMLSFRPWGISQALQGISDETLPF
jgi:hypothetical protein